MSPRMPRSFALVLVLAVGLLASCGDDGGPGEERSLADLIDETTTTTSTTEATTTTAPGADRDEYVAALAPQLTELSAGVELDPPDADCFAGAVIDVVGADALADAGVSPAQFAASPDGFRSIDVEIPDGATARLAEDISQCFDAGAIILGALAAEAPAGVDVTCMSDSIGTGDAEMLLARAIVEDSDAVALGEDFGIAIFQSLTPTCAEQVLLQWLTSDGTITAAQSECLAAELDDEVAVTLFQGVASGTGQADPAATEALAAAGAACGVS
ncbi:hypothetical protein [Actinomarinicola tropica]|uniref:DUF732 domain-containing protein n=1 Tax=Actinomarinicola tropica TaxID=2789776 RepID=A0A5Q2RK52_9ACTN|nr:hypothetical protein [Actinomarinicola tropica]QGG96213.1 hypothetical protein GH723_14490 [Actinomarinicola tropica]